MSIMDKAARGERVEAYALAKELMVWLAKPNGHFELTRFRSTQRILLDALLKEVTRHVPARGSLPSGVTRLEDVRSGDVLVVRSASADLDPTLKVVNGMNRALMESGIEVHFILLDPEASIERLDEDQMKENGWVRPWDRTKRLI